VRGQVAISMSHSYPIALDVMSGDHGASVIMPAALRALQEMDDIHLLLVGDEAVVAAHMRHWPESVRPRAQVIHASQTVAMEELAGGRTAQQARFLDAQVDRPREGGQRVCLR